MPSAFLDKTSPPSERELQRVLARAAPLWRQLLEDLGAAHAPLRSSWSWSGKSHGWLLKMQCSGRTLGYLIPCDGFLVASFALREKAHAAALAQAFPPAVRRALEDAPSFVEGRAVRLELRAAKDLAAVRRLVEVKLA